MGVVGGGERGAWSRGRESGEGWVRGAWWRGRERGGSVTTTA